MLRHCYRTFYVLMLALLTTACVYHPTVQQGNVITRTQAKAIHHGMTVRQVEKKLGEPILRNVFNDHRLVYVYTLQKSNDPMTHRRYIVQFRRGKVTHTHWSSHTPTKSH